MFLLVFILMALAGWGQRTAYADGCSLLAGWEGLERVQGLVDHIASVMSQTSSSNISEHCRLAMSHVIVAYDAIRQTALQDYEKYRQHQLSEHFRDHTDFKLFSFLRKFLMNGQVKKTWEEYRQLERANDPRAAEVKARLATFIHNKYERLAVDQRRIYPQGPIIIPLARVECPWRSVVLGDEQLVYSGRQVSNRTYCYPDSVVPLHRYSFPYQLNANSIGFKIEDERIVTTFCQQQSTVEEKVTGIWPFEYRRHVTHSRYQCTSMDLVGGDFLTSPAAELGIEEEFSHKLDSYQDQVLSHYEKKLQKNPQLSNKILNPDEWWLREKAALRAPTFANFLAQYFPARCPRFGVNHQVLEEDERPLRERPPFWHFRDTKVRE